jgi:Tol biopolymer transport system component
MTRLKRLILEIHHRSLWQALLIYVGGGASIQPTQRHARSPRKNQGACMITRLIPNSPLSSVVIAAFLSLPCGAPVTAQETDWPTIEFETTGVTDPELAVSPDGGTLVFTTLGHLFRFPDGGGAEQLTLQQAEPSVSKVADVPWPVSVSPDGRLVTGFFGTPAGNLAVRDLITGETRNLTEQGYPQLHMGSLFSPDGDQIAYVWHNEHDFDDLRLIQTDGSDQRLLFRDADVRSVGVKDWTEDGSRILVTIVKFDATAEVAYVPVAGGVPEVIVSLNPGEPLPQAMAISPDGRFIAYDVSTEPDGSAHDICLMLGDGSAPKPIVQHPGDDRLLAWSPDGKGILFASDRRGSVDIWLASVSDGVSRGDLRLLKRDVGQFTSLGLARDGSYYFGVKRYGSQLYIADLDRETGRLDGSPRIVAPALHRSDVDWSPDGRYLAYAKSGGGVLEGSWVLVVRSLDTGEETEFTLQIDVLHELHPSWSPDGQLLLVSGWERGAYPRVGVYTVRVETGEVTTLFASESVWRRDIAKFEWSPDGQALFYREEGGGWSIVMRELTSGQETYLVRDAQPPWHRNGTLSPDGRMWATAIYDPDRRKDALVVMSLKDGERQVLLEPPERIGPHAWTPDSRHLVYQSQGHLWRISAEGGDPEELGTLGADTYRRFNDLSVHPDGHRIAFVAETESKSEVWKITGLLAAR